MTNPVYQAAVEELEAVLSPRIVSRSLKEGLRQVGSSPDTVSYGELEKILKSQVYRQLQVSMPVTKAKEKITHILERIKNLEPGSGPSQSGEQDVETNVLEQQAEALEQLRQALKPFNLYFEWPEVQKLRAQIQLLESEQDAGREASKLVQEANAQLTLVRQKLEDQLVLQAQHLGELEAALEQVSSIGGVKVRRLEHLVGQIRDAQQERHLAAAEIERARKLATELRKLLESSVYADKEATDDAATVGAEATADALAAEGLLDADTEVDDLLTIDPAGLDPDVTAKLLLLDVENERHELNQLEKEHAVLLAYRPDLREQLEALRSQLDEQRSVGEALHQLTQTFTEATAAQRETLRAELEAMQAEVEQLGGNIDTAEVEQAIKVALGILANTLPHQSDIQHIRNLHQLNLEQAAENARLAAEAEAAEEAQLKQQAEMLARLESMLVRYNEADAASPEFQQLAGEVSALKEAQSGRALAPDLVASARQAQEQLEAAIAKRASDDSERQRAQLRALLAQLQALPALEAVAAEYSALGSDLERLLEQAENGPLDAGAIHAASERLAALRMALQQTFAERLSALGRRAQPLDAAVRAHIDEAARGLVEDRFPDLHALESIVQQAYEAKRREQVDDLHQLEQEVEQFAGLELEELTLLRNRIAATRAAIEQGELATELDQAWAQLESFRTSLEQRFATFPQRLDAALVAFEEVAPLNSEDVGTVRRILTHLDSQRDAFARISIGLRVQLEHALQEAETLLVKLRQEFEATRAVADQLVSENVIDDILGVLGAELGHGPGPTQGQRVGHDSDLGVGEPPLAPGAAASGASTGAAGATTASATATAGVIERRSNHPELDRWVGEFLTERGVAGIALYRLGGDMVVGRLGLDPEQLQRQLERFGQDAAAIGQELELGPLRLATLEMPNQILIEAWPTPQYALLILLDAPSVLSLVLHRLRRDIDQLRDLLGGPAFA